MYADEVLLPETNDQVAYFSALLRTSNGIEYTIASVCFLRGKVGLHR